MLALKYLLILSGAGLWGFAGWWSWKKRSVELPLIARLGAVAIVLMLLGMSIQVVPSGAAGIRVSQLSGTLPTTLYPGTHFVLPLIQHVVVYDTRDNVFQTVILADPKQTQTGDQLKVQTREGLMVGLAVAVRYRLDPQKLSHIHANLPQPVEKELVPPVVASAFREVAPNYTVRELFAAKREEVRKAASDAISKKLAADAILVKEVMLRDIQLPAEYAKGLEGLLLKEQENERLGVEMEVKAKLVKAAELEAEAVKARQVKQAEADAQVVVLQSKAQADAMQYTLPLKEKQIQQTKLEAEARKESTVKQAEAAAAAKVIDGKAELERRKLMNEADLHRVQVMSKADAERMRMEASVLKESPLLIQKIIAERLSDKVQIMMVPNDGKFFFANDVLRGAQNPFQMPVAPAVQIQPQAHQPAEQQ
ncbi:MAG: SPFH domain-containing protein [Bryobacteraceae bacterium]